MKYSNLLRCTKGLQGSETKFIKLIQNVHTFIFDLMPNVLQMALIELFASYFSIVLFNYCFSYWNIVIIRMLKKMYQLYCQVDKNIFILNYYCNNNIFTK